MLINKILINKILVTKIRQENNIAFMLYSQEEVNLHTHSFYCGHGKGLPSDFIASARSTGRLKVLGFSEHCPVPDDSLNTRMPYSMLDVYAEDVRKNQSNEDYIKILLGAECDWYPKFKSFYSECILGEKHFDYAIGAIHFLNDSVSGVPTYIPNMKLCTPKDIGFYADSYSQMLASGLFTIGCHPDLFFGGYRKWDAEAIAVSKEILSCAKDCNIVLEMNDLGLRKPVIETDKGLKHQYSNPEFWELALSFGVKICTNSDAHVPVDVSGYATDGFPTASFKLASEIGIKFVSWNIKTFKGLSKAEISAK